MKHNVYVYIILMAVVTYLIRMLPLVIMRRPIKNRFFRSFLYYVPFVTLSVMTFPAILSATGSPLLGFVGLSIAIILSLFNLALPIVAFVSCIGVYVLGFFIL